MRIKAILVTVVLIAIVFLALFGTGVKKMAIKALAEDIPDYYCGKDEICTTCIIKGQSCSCGETVCECGNRTVKSEECYLIGK